MVSAVMSNAIVLIHDLILHAGVVTNPGDESTGEHQSTGFLDAAVTSIVAIIVIVIAAVIVTVVILRRSKGTIMN